jgi:hypothetical protein
MKRVHLHLIAFIISFSIFELAAQDVGNIIKSKPFTFSGSLYIGGDGFTSFGNDPLRRSPYSYSII